MKTKIFKLMIKMKTAKGYLSQNFQI